MNQVEELCVFFSIRFKNIKYTYMKDELDCYLNYIELTWDEMREGGVERPVCLSKTKDETFKRGKLIVRVIAWI